MVHIRTLLLAVTLFLLFINFDARAAECDEWANMTKILVVRWQHDPNFTNIGLADVKRQLNEMMGDNPEIKTAQKWVDYAHKHKNDDPIEVWKGAYAKCNRENSI